MEKIRIKYHSDIDRLEKTEKGDWIDLRVGESTHIGGYGYKAVPLGVSMELPKGYEAIIAPRSSFYKNHGCLVANSIGIMDESYCGDNDQWHLLVYNNSAMPVLLTKNTRIAQFRIIEHQPAIEFEEVESLGNENRGGIGSTGKE